MSECYCAQIVDGVVTNVIVCDDSEWAAQHLGGEWMCAHEQLVSIGWVYRDGKFLPPEGE